MQDNNKAPQELENEFSKSWEQSDVVLLVEGQQFHVHRVILAMISPVFSRMFSSDFKEKDADKIPLPEKKAAEIREMLLVIYPSFCKPVNEINLHFLLPLSREYQITVLTQKCEDCLLRVIEKEDEIGPLLENLIIAQNYTLERVKSECVNKTQKLSIEEVQGHELYERVEPLSQRKMTELQMSNMKKRLDDANAEISRLRGKITNMKLSASEGLQHFDSVVSTLGDHIRRSKNSSAFPEFKFTTEQNLATIRHDTSGRKQGICLSFSGTYGALQGLQKNLNAIKDSNYNFTLPQPF